MLRHDNTVCVPDMWEPSTLFYFNFPACKSAVCPSLTLCQAPRINKVRRWHLLLQAAASTATSTLCANCMDKMCS